MNISQITAFHAVMTSPTLSEAAKKLGRTQPAVSAAIRTLEADLGLKLFQRTGRKLVPVPEAHYLLTEAGAVLSQLSRVRQTMRSLGDGRSGSLKLAAMPGPASMLFPRFIASQSTADLDFKVSIIAQNSVQIAELARTQNIDFGFADAPATAEPAHLFSAEVISGTCAVAVPRGHRLAEHAAVSLDDLDGVPLGALQAGHEHQRDLVEKFAARGLRCHIRVESQTFLPVLQFVAAGQCSVVLDPLTAVHIEGSGHWADDIAVKPLRDVIRYRYAIYTPSFRPVSLLAERMRAAWRDEVVAMLARRGADPRLEPAQASIAEISSS